MGRVARILDALSRPLRIAELSELCQAPREELKRALRVLLDEQMVLSGSKDVLLSTLPAPAKKKRPCKRLVLGITGAVHAVLVVPLVVHLRRMFAEHIDVVLTGAAQKFLKPAAFSYFGLDVWTDPFKVCGEINVPHVHLASRAELVAIIPASAHTIHRL